jgi:hypothetical protein
MSQEEIDRLVKLAENQEMLIASHTQESNNLK